MPVSLSGSFLETPNTRRTFDLAHGVCQTLAGDKLHKTNVEDDTDLTCRPVRVKEIGPRMSKVSDGHDTSGPLLCPKWMRMEGDFERVCRFVVCRLAFPLVD